MHCDTLKQDDSTVRGHGESRVGEVRAGTTSPMPEHKGFKLQLLSEIHPFQQPDLAVLSVKLHTSEKDKHKEMHSICIIMRTQLTRKVMSHVHSFHWFFIHTNATWVINPAVCGYGFSDLSFRFTSIQFTFKKQSQDFTTESNKFVLYAISDTQRVWMFHWVVKNTFFYSTICTTWWKIQQYSWVYCDERSYATEFNSRLLLSKERLITQKLIYLILLIEQFCKDFCSLITSTAVIHTTKMEHCRCLWVTHIQIRLQIRVHRGVFLSSLLDRCIPEAWED